MGHKRRDADLVAMMQGLQKGTIKPESLTPRQRKLMVMMIIRENSTITNGKIASLIGVGEAQVSRIRHAAIKCTSFDVDSEVRELVNVVWMKAGEYQRRAIADNDPRTAWSIFKESVELMQRLGFVFEAPKKIALAHFQGQEDFQTSLRRMFDDTGVPTLPAFVEKLRLLSAGGNGNGNGNGSGGGNGKGNGSGRVLDVTALVAGDSKEGEPSGDSLPPGKRAKD